MEIVIIVTAKKNQTNLIAGRGSFDSEFLNSDLFISFIAVQLCLNYYVEAQIQTPGSL